MIGTEKGTRRGRGITSLAMTMVVQNIDAYINTPPFDLRCKLQEITQSCSYPARLEQLS